MLQNHRYVAAKCLLSQAVTGSTKSTNKPFIRSISCGMKAQLMAGRRVQFIIIILIV
jgi:hypothetical protein